jgi:rod shape-determining protein MreC
MRSRFRIKSWMLLVAVLLLLVVAFFVTFFATGGASPGPSDVLGSAAQPAVSGAHGFGASIKQFFLRLFGLRDVDKQYEQMLARIQMLETETQFMQDYQAELERLTNLLGFQEQYPEYSCMPARVIGKQPGSWFLIITLDKGSAHGVEVDMSVVNENGLVGRVSQVGRNWCKVMTVIDRQSSVPGIVERTRDFGIVQGCGDPHVNLPICDIMWLPSDSELAPGDIVKTSDFGGIFPKGLIIGTVTAVGRNEKNERTAQLAPAVDFARLENVLIIKSNKEAITEEDIKKEIEEQEKAQQEAEAGEVH